MHVSEGACEHTYEVVSGMRGDNMLYPWLAEAFAIIAALERYTQRTDGVCRTTTMADSHATHNVMLRSTMPSSTSGGSRAHSNCPDANGAADSTSIQRHSRYRLYSRPGVRCWPADGDAYTYQSIGRQLPSVPTCSPGIDCRSPEIAADLN